MQGQPALNSAAVRYEIIIAGQLDPYWAASFEELTLESCPAGLTRLHGALPDQSALRAVLERIFDLNLQLISVQRLSQE